MLTASWQQGPGACRSADSVLSAAASAARHRVHVGSDLYLETSHAQSSFERKGHQFVDLDVAAFDQHEKAVLSARMRCIYQLSAS